MKILNSPIIWAKLPTGELFVSRPYPAKKGHTHRYIKNSFFIKFIVHIYFKIYGGDNYKQ